MKPKRLWELLDEIEEASRWYYWYRNFNRTVSEPSTFLQSRERYWLQRFWYLKFQLSEYKFTY